MTMTPEEATEFFRMCMDESGKLIRLFFNDKEAYIEAKKNDPMWSNLTLALSEFQEKALVCLSFFKYNFREVKKIE